jgi:hypothetical protein
MPRDLVFLAPGVGQRRLVALALQLQRTRDSLIHSIEHEAQRHSVLALAALLT